jgi:hypothetical protein
LKGSFSENIALDKLTNKKEENTKKIFTKKNRQATLCNFPVIKVLRSPGIRHLEDTMFKTRDQPA